MLVDILVTGNWLYILKLSEAKSAPNPRSGYPEYGPGYWVKRVKSEIYAARRFLYWSLS